MPEFVITDAGLAAAQDAANRGLTLRLTTIVVGDGRHDPDATATALAGTELARAPLGQATSTGPQTTMHALFEAGAWTAYELGVLTADGTLFAIKSAADGSYSLTKASSDTIALSTTILLSGVPSGSVTVSAAFEAAVEQATETRRGIAEIADNTEMDTGTDDERIVTPAKLERRIGQLVIPTVPNASTTRRGISEQATVTEARAGTDTQRHVTPEGVRAHGDARYLQQAGGTLTGALNLVSPADADNSQKAAPTSWIRRLITSALGAYVLKAGDTLTGDLLTVTPAANDNSKKAVNSEWVRGRLAGLGNVTHTWLYWNAAGLDIQDRSNTPINLLLPYTGYRELEVGYEWSGNSNTYFFSSKIPVASLPASFSAFTQVASPNLDFEISAGAGSSQLIAQYSGSPVTSVKLHSVQGIS